MRSIKTKIINRFFYLVYIILKFLRVKKVKSRYGVYFKSNFGDATFKFYILGYYGKFYWEFIKKKEGKFIFIDIGANQGLYSICAAKNKYCKKVYAFEPVLRTFKILKRNIVLNSLEHKTTLINKGIGAKKEKVQISINPNHSGAASLIKSLNTQDSFIENIEIIDGKDLIKLIKVSTTDQISVKIDVEGYEESVITALISSSIVDQINDLFYEVDTKWTNPNKIELSLRKNGFTKFKKIGKSNTHYDVLASR